MITAYEDTCFYALSGVASEKEEGSSVSGDNFPLVYVLESPGYIPSGGLLDSGQHIVLEFQLSWVQRETVSKVSENISWRESFLDMKEIVSRGMADVRIEPSPHSLVMMSAYIYVWSCR